MTDVLLSIAGYDPSGGAGVLLDVRVFERFGYAGWGVVTAVTAQSPRCVVGVFPVAASLLLRQYRSLTAGRRPAGVKVGMLASSKNLAAAGRILAENAGVPRVIDPVFRSSSGVPLLDRQAVPRFLRTVESRASLITPNLAEAAALAGRPVRTLVEMTDAARSIYERSGIPCLVKGGHLKGRAADLLFEGERPRVFEHRRVGKDVHGTGCFLSAAILVFLAGGFGLEEACRRAIRETCLAIARAVPAGGGRSVFAFGPRAGPWAAGSRGAARRS
jgi:hydroxymethylpyrimidine/phosphomethylpyrimidine kinase